MNWAIWTNSFCNLDIFSLRRGSATNAALQTRELCRPASDHNLVYLALRKMNFAILTIASFLFGQIRFEERVCNSCSSSSRPAATLALQTCCKPQHGHLAFSVWQRQWNCSTDAKWLIGKISGSWKQKKTSVWREWLCWGGCGQCLEATLALTCRNQTDSITVSLFTNRSK